MTASPITLSIVIPVFNAESTLEKCVKSVLSQKAAACCEVLLVNDGSTDSSIHVMENLALKFPGQIKTITKENKGPSDSRNVGIKNAKGQYIAFLDSDDTVEPHYLEEVLQAIQVHQPDMIFIDYNRIYTRKKNFLERVYPFKRIKPREGHFNITEYPDIIADVEVACWIRIVNRNLFDKNAELYFSTDLKLAEDLEASLKWYLFSEKLYILDKKIYNYLIRPASLNFSTDSIPQFSHIIGRVCNFYLSCGKFSQHEKQLEYVFSKHILLSNLFRLRNSNQKGAAEIFLELRKNMLSYFPDFIHNKYLKTEPIYVRLALYMAYRTPWIFHKILK